MNRITNYAKNCKINMARAKVVNPKVYAYILDSICADGYDGEDVKTDYKKLSFLYRTFLSEYRRMIERHGMQVAMKEWLQGTPSSINIVFSNFDIINLAKEWGSIPQDATEAQEQKILDNYWDFMAVKVIQLFRKHKVY